MVAETWLLLSLVVIGASFLVVHGIVLFVTLRAEDLEPRWKGAALIPFLTPAMAWKAGYRVWPIVWGALLIAYLVLRLVSGG
ncbi:MAG: hypothetical protein AAGF12_37280 [Myxococcota bacterium]